MTMHFEEDVIVLEKWIPNKPITVIYFDGQRERYYLKRFLIENPDKLEVIISDHPKSKLEIVSTEYRPVFEVQFSKRNLDSMKINAEEFIDIKGLTALGNLLTKDKIKQVNNLESLPYEVPDIENIEVNIEVIKKEKTPQTTKKDSPLDSPNKDPEVDEDGQTLLF